MNFSGVSDWVSASPPIRITSLSDEIADAIQRAILAGEYQPGQRLIERQLAERFGVSSIPVREALQELENRGLVVRSINRGCAVRSFSDDDTHAIGELRRVLEPAVVAWAASRMTPERAVKLHEQLKVLVRAAARGALAEFLFQDLCFHRLVWEASGNRYAARALERALGCLLAAMVAKGVRPNLRNEVKKRRHFLQALLEGNARQAATILLSSGTESPREAKACTAPPQRKRAVS